MGGSSESVVVGLTGLLHLLTLTISLSSSVRNVLVINILLSASASSMTYDP